MNGFTMIVVLAGFALTGVLAFGAGVFGGYCLAKGEDKKLESEWFE